MVKAASGEELLQRALLAQQRGDPAAAEQLYGQLLHRFPSHLAAWCNLGAIKRQQGDLAGAESCYRQALKNKTAPPEVWFNLGNLHLAMGQQGAAEGDYRQLLALQPRHREALMQLARTLQQQGRLHEAVQSYQWLLQHHSQFLDGWLELGNCQRALLQGEAAAASYRQLLALQPDHWKGHYALGRLLLAQGAEGEARIHVEQALALAPDPSQLLATLGQAHLQEGRAEAASETFRRALAQRTDNGGAKLGLATALMRLGRSAEAYPLFEQLSGSSDVALLNRLAEISMSFNLWQESLAILRRVVALTANHLDARYNLATAATTAYQLGEALALIEQCIRERPGQPAHLHQLAQIQVKRGDVEAALRAFAEEEQLRGHSEGVGLNFARLYSDRIAIETHSEQHRRAAPRLPGAVAGRTPARRAPADRSPLRIGYVSGDIFYQHPVDIFLQPILQHHDRRHFHLTLYYNGSGYDARTRLARSRVDRWHGVNGWSDEQLLEQIAQDRIDILVDLSGHTGRNRLSVFARRAAPIQMTMIGYPFTTGLDTIDYLLGDAITTPLAEQPLYSERLLHLDRFVFCYPDDLHPPPQPRPPRREVVFGSFNNIPKLTPATVQLWARVLQAVPQSRLLLKAPSFQDEGTCERYRRQFAERGVDAARLTFRGPTALPQMMNEYADIDIALDPLPFNGGTTTLQALWAATPVVTLAGSGFFQRMGASILTHLGRSEWIAGGPDDYVAIAAALATDRPRLQQIHATLHQQVRTSSLTDTAAYTRALEAIYQQLMGAS